MTFTSYNILTLNQLTSMFTFGTVTDQPEPIKATQQRAEAFKNQFSTHNLDLTSPAFDLNISAAVTPTLNPPTTTLQTQTQRRLDNPFH